MRQYIRRDIDKKQKEARPGREILLIDHRHRKYDIKEKSENETPDG